MFSSTSWEELQRTTEFTHRFAFQNRGAVAARITGVRTSCACVTAEYPEDTIAPGAEGAIEVKVRLEGKKPERHRFLVTVTYEAGTIQTAQLVIEVTKPPFVRLYPPSLTLTLGSGKTSGAVAILDDRPEPLIIERTTASAGLRAEIVGPEKADDCWRFSLRIEASPTSFPSGESHGLVLVKTNDPANPELRLPVTVIQPPRLRVVPALVTFAGSQATVEARFAIEDGQGKEVKIQSFAPPIPGVRVETNHAPNGACVIRLTADRGIVEAAHFPIELPMQVLAPVAAKVSVTLCGVSAR